VVAVEVVGIWIDLFDVREVAYDPRYFERSAELVDQRLPESLIFPVEPSSRLMRDALQTFYRVVHEGTLRHRGDPVIAAHLANCAVERGFRDEIRRVRKIDERKPNRAIDQRDQVADLAHPPHPERSAHRHSAHQRSESVRRCIGAAQWSRFDQPLSL
jgi:phage terminase large subunit-like protein